MSLLPSAGYSEGSRRFDKSGTALPAATFRKATAGGYLEYGLTSYLSLVAAPTLSRQNGSGAENSITGSDSSAFGARLQVFSAPRTVVAVQALVQPPLGGGGSAVGQIAAGGSRNFAVDLRMLVGRSFSLFGYPAFVDVEPGARLRAEPFPSEARLDLAFGVRPVPRLMILLQDFLAFAPARGPLIERSAYSKLQLTLVYDLTAVWSVQAGAFRTIAGRNAVRETGPLIGLWYRF